jgi:hypothetical protein
MTNVLGEHKHKEDWYFIQWVMCKRGQRAVKDKKKCMAMQITGNCPSLYYWKDVHLPFTCLSHSQGSQSAAQGFVEITAIASIMIFMYCRFQPKSHNSPVSNVTGYEQHDQGSIPNTDRDSLFIHTSRLYTRPTQSHITWY